MKVPTQTAETETQPAPLVTKVTDLHGISLRDLFATRGTPDTVGRVMTGGEQAPVAAFNASL